MCQRWWLLMHLGTVTLLCQGISSKIKHSLLKKGGKLLKLTRLGNLIKSQDLQGTPLRLCKPRTMAGWVEETLQWRCLQTVKGVLVTELSCFLG